WGWLGILCLSRDLSSALRMVRVEALPLQHFNDLTNHERRFAQESTIHWIFPGTQRNVATICARSSAEQQRISNSRKRFCVRFHWLAQRHRRWAFRSLRIRAALRRLAHFCSQNLSDRRNRP